MSCLIEEKQRSQKQLDICIMLRQNGDFTKFHRRKKWELLTEKKLFPFILTISKR